MRLRTAAAQRMKRSLLAILVALLGTTSSLSAEVNQKEKAKLEERAKATLAGYYTCANKRADALAGGTAQPSDIADAALGACVAESIRYGSALRDYMIGISRRGSSVNPVKFADDDLAIRQKNLRLEIINRVLTVRASSATAVPSDESDADHIKAAGKVYNDCVFAAAAAGIETKTPALEVADDALDRCVAQYHALQVVLLAPRYAQVDNASRLREEAFGDKIRSELRTAVIDAVIEARTPR